MPSAPAARSSARAVAGSARQRARRLRVEQERARRRRRRRRRRSRARGGRARARARGARSRPRAASWHGSSRSTASCRGRHVRATATPDAGRSSSEMSACPGRSPPAAASRRCRAARSRCARPRPGFPSFGTGLGARRAREVDHAPRAARPRGSDRSTCWAQQSGHLAVRRAALDRAGDRHRQPREEGRVGALERERDLAAVRAHAAQVRRPRRRRSPWRRRCR